MAETASPRVPHMVRNTLFNLSGTVLPVPVALIAVPIIVHGYGDERFALLMLTINLLITFAFFDMGIGLGTIRSVAAALGDGRKQEVPAIIWSSVVITGMLGAIFGAALYAAVPFAVALGGDLSPALLDETRYIYSALALSIPVVTVATVLRGVLEAGERFDITNGIKVPSILFLFLIPMLGVAFSLPLKTVTLLLVLSRVLTLGAFLYAVARQYPRLFSRMAVRKSVMGALLRFGGWVSISNVVNPVVMHGERFLIPMFLSLQALAFYSAPHEVIARLAIMPFSFATTLFPRFSANRDWESPEFRSRYIHAPLRYLLLLLTPACLLAVYFAPELLRVWLGERYATESFWVMRILTLGFYANAFAYIAWGIVQGSGRPDWKAKLDLAELALYLAGMWLLIPAAGIEGAAVVKSAVFVVDAFCLYAFTARLTRAPIRHLMAPGMPGLFACSAVGLAAGIVVPESLAARIPVFLAVLGAFLFFYGRMYAAEDVALLKTIFRRPGAAGKKGDMPA